MSQDKEKRSTTNELARERNLLAGDRTLMAWLRTSLSLIGFGFAIAQGYEFVEASYFEETGKVIDTNHTPFYFGISFMVLGLLGTLGGVIQYQNVLKRLRNIEFAYQESWPFSLIVAVLLLIIGIVGLVTLLL